MRSILFFICLIFTFGGQAQEEEKSHMWKVELSGALNNNSAWEVEPSVTYLLIPYVGITMEDKDTGLSLVVSPGLTIPLPVNQEFNISYVPNTPGVWIPQKFDHIKNKGGKSLFYHIKSMLSLDIDQRYIFSLGYIFSNFDLYSGGRNFVVEGKRLSMPRIRFMHSFFLSIGYRF